MSSGDSDPLAVSSQEFGTVRVFALTDNDSMPVPDVREIGKMLGDVTLVADKVEVVKSRAIEGLGLTGYLRDGYGVAEAELAGRRGQLDATNGILVFLPTSAFGGVAQTLSPAPELRFIGLFHEERATPPRQMTRPEAAKGTLSSPESTRAVSGRERRKPTWLFVLGGLLLAVAIILIAVV